MNETLALIRTEAKLLFREPISWLAAIALPSAVLVIFGGLFAGQGPDPGLGGLRFIDVFVPSLVVITVGTLGIQTLPIRLATYREKGVLRRLSTTPAHPMRLLTAQLVTYLATALMALALLIVVARIVYDVPFPHDVPRLCRGGRPGHLVPVRRRTVPRGRRADRPGGDVRRDPAVLRRDVPRRCLRPACRVA